MMVSKSMKCCTVLLQMMEVLRDGSELVFLYQLVNGHSNNSLACHIASIAGLPQELVERGSEVSSYINHCLKPIAHGHLCTLPCKQLNSSNVYYMIVS